jgi:hypothetical protein
LRVTEQISYEARIRREELSGLSRELAKLSPMGHGQNELFPEKKSQLMIDVILHSFIEKRDGRPSLLNYLYYDRAGQKLLDDQNPTVKAQISLINTAANFLHSLKSGLDGPFAEQEQAAWARQHNVRTGVAIGGIVGLGVGVVVGTTLNAIHPAAGILTTAGAVAGPTLIGSGVGWGVGAGFIHRGNVNLRSQGHGLNFGFGPPRGPAAALLSPGARRAIETWDTMIADLGRDLAEENAGQRVRPSTSPAANPKANGPPMIVQAAAKVLPLGTRRPLELAASPRRA